ncbi:MAG: DUF6318 family protein [Cellulomonas sp.]|nr:DUF6318 family protein [Cellulomonas sp.]
MRGPVGLVGLAGMVALVGVAGCSPGGAAPTAASVSVSSSPALPEPVASPGLPEHWADTGERGASVAAVWFVRDLYRYVVETNDWAQWQALSEPGCEFCTNTTQAAQQGLADGTVERLTSVQVAVTRVEELNPLSYAVLMDYADGVTVVHRLDGTAVESFEPSRGQLLVVMHLVGTDWQLREGQWFDEGVAVPTAGATS